MPTGSIDYAYQFGTGGWRLYDDHAGADGRRDYVYDAIGRLRSITLRRPSPGVMHAHNVTIIYDHRSRPMYVSDLDTDNNALSFHELYWDRDDQLIARIRTPDAVFPLQRSFDMYAHVEPIAVGSVTLDYDTAGVLKNTDLFYDIRDPVGLPVTRFEIDPTNPASTSRWTGQFAPFGEIVSETGVTFRPPWRFLGQLELPGSATINSINATLSSALYLNQWRVYDPRVGQYLTAEPVMVAGLSSLRGPDGSTREEDAFAGLTPVTYENGVPVYVLPSPPTTEHLALPYGYAVSSPQNYSDPSGEWPWEWRKTFPCISCRVLEIAFIGLCVYVVVRGKAGLGEAIMCIFGTMLTEAICNQICGPDGPAATESVAGSALCGSR